MVALSTSLGVAGIAVLVALSAFFSASEIAIFSTEPRAGAPADTGALARLREDPHRLLVTTLVSNNFLNVAIATLTTTLLVRTFSPETAAVVSTAVVGAVVLVFGEIVPGSYGVGNAEPLAGRVARPIELVGTVLYPVVAVISDEFGAAEDILTTEDVVEELIRDSTPPSQPRPSRRPSRRRVPVHRPPLWRPLQPLDHLVDLPADRLDARPPEQVEQGGHQTGEQQRALPAGESGVLYEADDE